MKKGFRGPIRTVLLAVFWAVLLQGWGCEMGTPPEPPAKQPQPGAVSENHSEGKALERFGKGEMLFNSHCARCHGSRAVGTDQGPPLVAKVYEPSHHGDASFHLAAQNGVRAHHWSFGDMPRIEGVSAAEVEEIIGYVRWVQRQAGVF